MFSEQRLISNAPGLESIQLYNYNVCIYTYTVKQATLCSGIIIMHVLHHEYHMHPWIHLLQLQCNIINLQSNFTNISASYPNLYKISALYVQLQVIECCTVCSPVHYEGNSWYTLYNSTYFHPQCTLRLQPARKWLVQLLLLPWFSPAVQVYM